MIILASAGPSYVTFLATGTTDQLLVVALVRGVTRFLALIARLFALLLHVCNMLHL